MAVRLWCRYTLGGLYFAQYDSSPAGKFDEVRPLKVRWCWTSMPSVVGVVQGSW